MTREISLGTIMDVLDLNLHSIALESYIRQTFALNLLIYEKYSHCAFERMRALDIEDICCIFLK